MKAKTLLKDPLNTDLSELDAPKLETLARDLARTALREQADLKEQDESVTEVPAERGKLYLESLAVIAQRDEVLSAVAFTAMQREGFVITPILQAARAYKEDPDTPDDHPVPSWLKYLQGKTVKNEDGRQAYVDDLEARAENFVAASSSK